MNIKELSLIVCSIVVALLISCSESIVSKEDKALDLIDEYMKSYLVSYDSYQPGSLIIDSAFNNPLIHPEVFKSIDVVIKSEEKLEDLEWDLISAESNYEYKLSMESLNSIYDRRSRDEREWDKSQMAKAKADLDAVRSDIVKYQNNVKESKNKILEIVNSCRKSREFIGWMLLHQFKSETRGGDLRNGSICIIADKDLKEVIVAFGDDFDTQEKIEKLQEIVDDEFN
jgi:hypothetical protein